MFDLNGFFDFLYSLPVMTIYLVLGISSFVENVFPPIPGDTITAFGAFMVGTGKVGFTGVLVSTTVGSLLGFMSLFWAGSLLGRRFFIQRDIWVFKKKDIIRAEEWFRRFGYMLILVNRFFPGIRSVISIAGGISGLDGRRAALLALTSALVWNLIWISLGYAMGSNWDIVKEKTAHIMLRYNILILALAVIIAVLYMIIRSIRKNRGR